MQGQVKPLPPHVVVPPAYRRHPIAALVLTLLILAAFADRFLAGHQEDDYRRYHGRVFRVVGVLDGRTLEIDVADRRMAVTRVRLWGVGLPGPSSDPDAPDLPAAEALAMLHDLALDRKVSIELAPSRSRDHQRLLLAYVRRVADDVAIAERLLEEGWLVADSEFQHPSARQYSTLEARARRRSLGSWARQAPAPSPAPSATSNGPAIDG